MSHEFWAKFDVPLADRGEARNWLVEFLKALPGPVDYDLLDDWNVDQVASTAVAVVAKLGGMLGFHDWGTFTCEEAEAFAALARAVDRSDIAGGVIREHARSDCEVTDVHHDIYLEQEQEE